jgi:hypothetical protein
MKIAGAYGKRRTGRIGALACIALAVAACGSGEDDGDNPPPPPTNHAPAANAGTDLTGATGQAITLAGSGTDADGDALTYEWIIVSGPANGGALTGATSASASFTATAAGAYVLRLTAKDPSTASGAASITVTITAPAANRVSVDKPFVFLSAIGQSSTLTASPVDGAGAPVDTPVTWTSSAPNQVNVDSSGHVMATSIGSAQIVAHAGGAMSAPVLVVVAEAKAGTVLVTDAQVQSVGAPIGVPPGEVAGVGTRYEVTLRGVPAPAAGTVVLAAETSPVAGKVVSTRTSGGDLIATLEIVPLYDLLARYHIDWNIDLSAFPLEDSVPADLTIMKVRRSHTAKAGIQEYAPSKLQNFWCEGDTEAKLASIEVDASATSGLKLVMQDYRDDPALPPNYSKHALEGNIGFTGTASVVFKPTISVSGTCRAEAHVKLPVFGWVSLIVMPQVSVGVGIELSAALVVATAEIGGTLNLDLKPVIGWECGGAEPSCRGVDNLTLDSKFTPKQEFQILNGMHAEVGGYLFAYARLDALLLEGLAGYVALIEGRMGPKQSLDLAFEPTQAENPSMASNYDLKIDGGVKPGDGLQAAIKKIINDDAVNVSFSLKQPIPVSESPKGTLRVNKSRVAIGDKVSFNVDIDPATKDYVGLGANFGKGYNIDTVELWRKKKDDIEFSFWKTMAPIASGEATAFQYDWTPEGTDAGTSKFAAFVNTEFLVPRVEVEANSVKEVEIACFSAGAQAAGRSAKATLASADSCADEWSGTAEHTLNFAETSTANITWKRDPTYDNGGRSTNVGYVATGTFEFHHLIYENAGCTVSPTTFAIPTVTPTTGVNRLVVDYQTVPAIFSGGGSIVREVTVSCPDDPPFQLTTQMYWFLTAIGEVSDGGLTVAGSFGNSMSSGSFRFVRP